ncbi:MAG: hypothetical protein AAFU77_02545 [Myxococcota bacterium]
MTDPEPESTKPAPGPRSTSLASGSAVDVKSALAGVDFERYQTDELRSSIEDILSVAGNVVFFLRTLFVTWLMGPIVMLVVFRESSWWVQLLWTAYGLTTFLLLGVATGIFFTQRRLLRNIVGIVDVIFEVSDKVLEDIGGLESRGVGATTAMLVSTVDGAVIRPVVEAVLTARFGFFARPLKWMYRGTISRTVAAIESALLAWGEKTDEEIQRDNAEREAAGDVPKTVLARARDMTMRVREFSAAARSVAIATAESVTRFALVPAFLLSTITAALALGPPLLSPLF